ncbi:uncharacterized protein LOC144033471 [Festucalex cinctus]
MCKVEMLRSLLNQRLSSAVEEVIGVFARTIAEYEEELSRTKEENERQRRLLAAVFKPPVVLHKEESSSKEYLTPDQQEWISKVENEPEPPRIKEEKEEADFKLPLTGIPLKVDDEDKEEGAGDHYVQLQVDSLLAPLSDCDDITSHSPDTDDENSKSDVTGHTGKKSWKCSYCGKTFTYSSGLMKHMRIHTGEQPFMCSVCGRRFAHKGNLTAHTRTHTGEIPYSCLVCNKSFRSHSACARHRKKHTLEEVVVVAQGVETVVQ